MQGFRAYIRVVSGLVLLPATLLLNACAYVPLNPNYEGPPPRPESMDQYYSKGSSYTSYTETFVKKSKTYTHSKFDIVTAAGPISVDYFALPKKSDSLIFVLPVLGGKNIIADYFARYFAKRGYDTAIVNRNNEFKDPAKFDQIEDVFRRNVVRDRIAIDFFEREFSKTQFGTFGISRGAINVAMSAGVDPRLKYNVMAMGGTDLVALFRTSSQRGVKKFRNNVREAKGLTKEQFYKFLEDNLKTDPKYLAKYIDARNTLMFLAVFDHAVPFKYGERLRQEIGKPRTVYILAGHFTSILFTQYAKLLLPWQELCFFPADYIESEALAFYDRSFKKKNTNLKMLPYRILQTPFNLIAGAVAN